MSLLLANGNDIPRYFIHASPAQKAYLKSLDARGINPRLGEREAILIAHNLAWAHSRQLGNPCKQGRIPIGEE